MMRLSKEDRKRLRREAESSMRHEEMVFTVVSPNATVRTAGPARVVAEAAKVGVRLEERRIDADAHVLGVPDQLETLSVALEYGVINREFLSGLNELQEPGEDQAPLAIGSPAISVRGQLRRDPAIDFVAMTVLRSLGRLTHGVLIDTCGSINDDWLAWSLDHMDPDMFKVTRVYEDPPPDFSSLAERYPQLVARAQGDIGSRRAWWRFW